MEKIHFITSDSANSASQEIENACMGGISLIQLRIKNISSEELLPTAIKVKEICDKYSATLIINDHVDIAKGINASGIHLGKNDMDPKEARDILGDNFIIGGTANTFEDIKNLAVCKVDYIGLGPFRFTETKQILSPILGINGFKTIMDKCKEHNINIPVFAIGGIKQGDIADILKTGIHGVAISGEIAHAENITETSKNIINTMKHYNI